MLNWEEFENGVAIDFGFIGEGAFVVLFYLSDF